ncbi:hypothetical protein HMPREF1870_01879 [Bacteroidales bacterium KA00344]|nr:hypothetical protein HMPREF1870_01879 [Bacteroidales bacterium KA00344]
MKKILAALFIYLPLMGMAQNTWEIPQEDPQQQQTQNKKTAIFDKKKRNEYSKYLVGAVPEVDGRVVFTLSKDVPGMTADEIYQKVYALLTAMSKEENQFPQSKIAVVNKAEHTIVARMKEWLVFQNTFLSLDRTVFNYTIIAKASDGHINLTLERLSYQYEMNRTDTNGGLNVKAEEWITDKEGLNKKRTKLAKYSGKFRRKTIDRKDNIFDRVCKVLGVTY